MKNHEQKPNGQYTKPKILSLFDSVYLFPLAQTAKFQETKSHKE